MASAGRHLQDVRDCRDASSALLGSVSKPGAPTIGTATGGNAQASVAFTAPASTGGYPVTSYTATSSPGGFTATGAASPLTVTGLANGTAYTFTVTATTLAGASPASSASNSVTPATVPGAPTIGTATAGAASASVAWTAPVSTGGSAITGYTVTSSPGGFTASGGASDTSATVAGLADGTAYTFTVTATNAIGTGPASAASNSVTPPLPTNLLLHSNTLTNGSWLKVGTNGAPTCTAATSDVTDPASGNAANKVVYTASSGSGTNSVVVQAVTGVTNGAQYTFSVYLRTLSGTANTYIFIHNGTSLLGTPTLCAVTSAWQRFSVTVTTNNTTATVSIGVNRGVSGGFNAAMGSDLPAQTLYVYGPQEETGSSANTLVINA